MHVQLTLEEPQLLDKHLCITWTPQKLRCPSVYGELVPGAPHVPHMPKSADAQVPYIKRQRSMHTVGSPHPRTPNHGSKKVQVLIKKYPHISGPM